jgi:hypothetical protein
MRSLLASIRTLVLPYGATTPPEIILDGTTGRIKVIAANGAEIDIAPEASGPQIQFYPASFPANSNPGIIDGFNSNGFGVFLQGPTVSGHVHTGNISVSAEDDVRPATAQITAQQTTVFSDALTIEGETGAACPTSITGDVTLTGSESISGTLGVTGQANLNGGAVITGNETVSGTVTASTSLLSPRGDAEISGAAETRHTATLINSWTATGDIAPGVGITYMMNLAPANSIHVRIAITGGTTSAGVALNSAVPAAYRPASKHLFGAFGTSAAVRLSYTTGGQFLLDSPSGALVFYEGDITLD